MNKRFVDFQEPRAYLRGTSERATAVLQVLRTLALLLTLALLAGATAFDFSARSDAPAIAGHARFASSTLARFNAMPQAGAAHARLGSTHARLITAELEDGPEGEEAPLATFVKFLDDDQLRSSGECGAVQFRIVAMLRPENVRRRALHPVHVGFPTGPPAA